MDYRYTMRSADTIDDAYLAKWLEQTYENRTEIAHTYWETAACDVTREVTSRIKAEVRHYDANRGFLQGPDYMLRWNLAGPKIGVYVWHKADDPVVVPLLHKILPPVDNSKLLKWWYNGASGLTHQDLPLTGSDPLPEFYPWVDDLNKLYDDYINSSANILILIGPPGTGKTTFIRGLLRKSFMQAWVTYDPKVQSEDALYLQFATNEAKHWDEVADRMVTLTPGGRMLVLEDADAMLESRNEVNALMSRLLNLSDGLVSLPARKIVFSTNLPELSSVDSALLRPGRCFGVVNFRTLTASEARNAAGAVDPFFTRTFDNNEKYTLAEALNRQHEGKTNVVRKIGFA